MEFIF